MVKLQHWPRIGHGLGKQVPGIQVLPEGQACWVMNRQSDPQHAPGWGQRLGEHAPPTVHV